MDQAVADLSHQGAGEGDDISLRFAIDLLQKAERHGFDMTLIAARHLGPDLEAWTLAAALATQTSTMELMVAAHPGINTPQMVAKMAASLDRISQGRCCLNIVNGWNEEEFETFGNGAWPVSEDERYARMDEYVQVIRGLFTQDPFTFEGSFYRVHNSRLPLKTRRMPSIPLYAASRSAAGKRTIAQFCDHWFVPDCRDFRLYQETCQLAVREIVQMNEMAGALGRQIGYGMSAHVVCAKTVEAARARAEALEEHGKRARYNRSSISGLAAGLVGTPDLIAERIIRYKDMGLGLMLFQFNPMEEGLDQFVSEVMPLVR
jgi:FMNH2-dependent dimethyl sulfone monooxygenase